MLLGLLLLLLPALLVLVLRAVLLLLRWAVLDLVPDVLGVLAVAALLLLLLEAVLPAAGRVACLAAGFAPFLPPDFTMLTPAAIKVTAATAAPAITPTDMPPFSLAAGAAVLTGAGAT